MLNILAIMIVLFNLVDARASTIVGRTELSHPDLGDPGGTGLHTEIRNAWTSLSDNANSRFNAQAAIGDSTTVNIRHNFGVPFAELKVLLYTGTHPLLVRVADPVGAGWTIAAGSPANEVIDITTPPSGGPHTFAVQISHGVGVENLGDLLDVDVATTPPEDNQALVFQTSSGDWVPGSSGDSSFKCQTVSDPNITLKEGGIFLANNTEIFLTADLTVSLDTILGGDPVDATTYYFYADLDTIPQPTVVGGRSVRVVSLTSHFLVSTSIPNTQGTTPSNRYVPLCIITSATTGNTWSGAGSSFVDLSKRRHSRPVVNVSPTDFELTQSVGTVGSVDNSQSALIAGDFPGAGATTSFYALEDVNDDSANGRNLTGNGSPVFEDATGFYQTEVLQLDGSTQFVNTTNAFFGGGDADQSFGIWAKLGDYSSGAVQHIIGQWDTAGSEQSIRISLNSTGDVQIRLSTDGTSETTTTAALGATDNTWVHFAAVYTASSDSADLYIDGQLTASVIAGSGIFTPVSPDFTIGATPTAEHARGSFQSFFFTQQVLTAEQINIIYSKRFLGKQIAGGHILAADSFPNSVTLANKSFYNLADLLDASSNSRDLTNNSSVTFDGADIFGTASRVSTFNGSNWLSSTDSFYQFDLSQSAWSTGGWVRMDDWSPGANEVISSVATASTGYRLAVLGTTGNIEVSGNTVVITHPNTFRDGTWKHIAFTADPSGNTTLYVDGNQVAQAASDYINVASATFTIGAFGSGGTSGMNGRVQDYFFVKGLLTGDDVKKLAAARIDHIKSVPSSSQSWTVIKGSGDNNTIDQPLDNATVLVDKGLNNLYANFGLESGDNITLRLQNQGFTTTTVPQEQFTTGKQSADPGAQTHGLGCRPKDFYVLHTQLTGDDEKRYDLCEADDTTVTCALGPLTINGAQPVEIVASCAPYATTVDLTTDANILITQNVTTKDVTVSAGQTLFRPNVEIAAGNTITVDGTWETVGEISGDGTLSGTGIIRSLDPGQNGETFGNLIVDDLTANGTVTLVEDSILKLEDDGIYDFGLSLNGGSATFNVGSNVADGIDIRTGYDPSVSDDPKDTGTVRARLNADGFQFSPRSDGECGIGTACEELETTSPTIDNFSASITSILFLDSSFVRFGNAVMAILRLNITTNATGVFQFDIDLNSGISEDFRTTNLTINRSYGDGTKFGSGAIDPFITQAVATNKIRITGYSSSASGATGLITLFYPL